MALYNIISLAYLLSLVYIGLIHGSNYSSNCSGLLRAEDGNGQSSCRNSDTESPVVPCFVFLAMCP